VLQHINRYSVLEHFTLEMLCKDLPKSLPRDGRRRVLLAFKLPTQALLALTLGASPDAAVGGVFNMTLKRNFMNIKHHHFKFKLQKKRAAVKFEFLFFNHQLKQLLSVLLRQTEPLPKAV
jgi:hypothetical protein